jgi:hypothetical protein
LPAGDTLGDWTGFEDQGLGCAILSSCVFLVDLATNIEHQMAGRFCVDNLGEIVWNDKAFDNLVLPGEEKELAWEFVESKALSNQEIGDFVAEKGGIYAHLPDCGF